MHAARAGAIVGFAGTSNVAAARIYGVPAVGTMAHSFVEVFPQRGGRIPYLRSTHAWSCDVAGGHL